MVVEPAFHTLIELLLNLLGVSATVSGYVLKIVHLVSIGLFIVAAVLIVRYFWRRSHP
jgi:hypothetical protein